MKIFIWHHSFSTGIKRGFKKALIMWSENRPNVYKLWGGRPKRRKSDPIQGQHDLHIRCFLFQDQISPYQYLFPLILHEFLKFTTKYLNYKPWRFLNSHLFPSFLAESIQIFLCPFGTHGSSQWCYAYHIATGIFPPRYRLNFPSAFNMADIEVNYAKARRDITFVSVVCTSFKSEDLKSLGIWT